MVEFFLNEQSLTLFSRGNFTEISMISYVCIHTEFYWNCFFRTNSCFDKKKSLTRPFSINQHYCTFEKNFVNLFSDCKLSLSRGSVGPEGHPHPGDRRNLSAQQNHFNSCTDVVWTLPSPGLVSVGVMDQGCVTAGRVVTPRHTQNHFCVWKSQLSSSWAPFPVLSVLEADCSYLIQFFLCFGDF